jgi:hypothetical protein
MGKRAGEGKMAPGRGLGRGHAGPPEAILASRDVFTRLGIAEALRNPSRRDQAGTGTALSRTTQ